MNRQFYYGFFDELEKSAAMVPTAAGQRLIGGGVGATAGALSTRRKPGESKSDYAKRTALTAGIGGLAGVAGTEGIRRGVKAYGASQIAKSRSAAADKVKQVAGLGSLGIALAGGKGTQAGKQIKGLQNVAQSGIVADAIRGGKGSTDKVLAGLGETVQKNEKGLTNLVSNFKKRRQFNRELKQFKADAPRSEADIRNFKKSLNKKLGFTGKQSSLTGDITNLMSGNKVQPTKTQDAMNFDRVKKDVFSTYLGSGNKAVSKRRFLGTGNVTKFTKGNARSAENQLNKGIERINNSDLLTSSQKSNMKNQLIKEFEKQYKVRVSDTGSMAGRTLRDRAMRGISGLTGSKNKYTFRAKSDNYFRTGEKIAHVADDILKKHGY